MKVIDAGDLMLCCQSVLYGTMGDGEREKLKEQLLLALDLEAGGLEQLLHAMAHDELTLRLRLYAQGAVYADKQAPPARESRRPSGALLRVERPEPGPT
jgi:hypothetical protein